MADKYDLNNYKKAKLILKDLKDLVYILDTCLKYFDPYKKYKPMANVISAIKINKSLLEVYLIKCNKIIESKGKVDG